MPTEPVDLLLIVPHPDDEVYGTGGTIAEYVARGRRVGLVTLTRGEKGRTLGLCNQDELAATRDLELLASVATLGIHEFRQHDFPDGGLADVPREAAIDRVLAEVEALRPRVVVTFPPDGSNGHRDHVATHQIAVSALERSGLPGRGTSLFYFAGPEPFTEEGRPLWKPPTHARDVTPYLVTKLTAIGCHRSQALSTADFLRRRAARIVTETFHRAVPEWTGPGLGAELE